MENLNMENLNIEHLNILPWLTTEKFRRRQQTHAWLGLRENRIICTICIEFKDHPDLNKVKQHDFLEGLVALSANDFNTIVNNHYKIKRHRLSKKLKDEGVSLLHFRSAHFCVLHNIFYIFSALCNFQDLNAADGGEIISFIAKKIRDDLIVEKLNSTVQFIIIDESFALSLQYLILYVRFEDDASNYFLDILDISDPMPGDLSSDTITDKLVAHLQNIFEETQLTRDFTKVIFAGVYNVREIFQSVANNLKERLSINNVIQCLHYTIEPDIHDIAKKIHTDAPSSIMDILSSREARLSKTMFDTDTYFGETSSLTPRTSAEVILFKHIFDQIKILCDLKQDFANAKTMRPKITEIVTDLIEFQTMDLFHEIQPTPTDREMLNKFQKMLLTTLINHINYRFGYLDPRGGLVEIPLAVAYCESFSSRLRELADTYENISTATSILSIQTCGRTIDDVKLEEYHKAWPIRQGHGQPHLMEQHDDDDDDV